VARGRIAARQPRTHCAPAHRLLSLLSALVWVNFASVLPVVLPMRSAKKMKNISRINDVTLSPMESDFFAYFQLKKKSSMKLARADISRMHQSFTRRSARSLATAISLLEPDKAAHGSL
jgi:hypothetical protein